MNRIDPRSQSIMQIVRTTAAPNEAGPVGLVQCAPNDLQTHDDTKLVQHFGFASAPPIGTDAVRLCAAGDTTKGIIIATNHAASRPRGLKPGSAVLYDQAGNGVAAGNSGVVTATAASGLSVAAPALRADGNIRSATGATGVFSTPSGKVVTARGGQFDTITAAGAVDVANPALQRLVAEIRACGDCSALNKLAADCSAELQKLVTDLTGEIGSLGAWTALLNPPEPTPQGIVEYLQKVIKVVFGAQFNAQITCIQKLAAVIQEVAEVPAAIADAAEAIGLCVASFPAVATGSLPPLPVAPPGFAS